MVPVVNGIHLHSIYNPLKEAENLFEENKNLIEQNNQFLVLGLGFGYHVLELIKRLEEKYGNNYRILVIEPIEQLIEGSKENLQSCENLEIITGNDIEELYNDRKIINFLVQKPALLAHPASFNLSKDFFTSLLKFKSDNTIDKARYLVQNPIIKNILSEYPHNITLDELIENKCTPKQAINEEMDYIFHIYRELSKQTGSIEEAR